MTFSHNHQAVLSIVDRNLPDPLRQKNTISCPLKTINFTSRSTTYLVCWCIIRIPLSTSFIITSNSSGLNIRNIKIDGAHNTARKLEKQDTVHKYMYIYEEKRTSRISNTFRFIKPLPKPAIPPTWAENTKYTKAKTERTLIQRYA